jgi:hypothetical protein
MAKFKISSTKKAKNENMTIFKIDLIEGSLDIGESFTCYDTHHPVEFTIFEITNNTELLCNNNIPWDDQFKGGEVDTEGKTRIEKFALSGLLGFNTHRKRILFLES